MNHIFHNTFLRSLVRTGTEGNSGPAPVEPPGKVVSLDTNRTLWVKLLRGAVDSSNLLKQLHSVSAETWNAVLARPSVTW